MENGGLAPLGRGRTLTMSGQPGGSGAPAWRPRAATAEAPAAVRAAVGRARAAAERGDVSAYLAALTDDAVILWPNEAPRRGAALGAFLEGFLGRYRIRWSSFTSTDLVIFDDYGYHAYRYAWELFPRGSGGPLVVQGEGIHILRPQADGSWRIARELWSETTPPASLWNGRRRRRGQVKPA